MLLEVLMLCLFKRAFIFHAECDSHAQMAQMNVSESIMFTRLTFDDGG